MSKNLVVTLADSRFIERAKQLFASVYLNAGWLGDYLLLAQQIPAAELLWFKQRGILIKECEPIIAKSNGQWPATVFSKIHLFSPEFKKWKNIVFLDADIIVKTPLTELVKIQGLGARPTHLKLKELFLSPWEMKLRNINDAEYERLKKNYDFNQATFNSGVMAFNTAVIKNDTFAKLKRLAESGAEIMYGDEAIFNLAFCQKWQSLPFFYNVLPEDLIMGLKMKPADLDGFILHFTKDKPWERENLFYGEWQNNLKKAEQINFQKQPPLAIKPKKIQSNDYQKRLNFFWRLRKFGAEKYARISGLIGLLLAENSPFWHQKLKNFDWQLKKFFRTTKRRFFFFFTPLKFIRTTKLFSKIFGPLYLVNYEKIELDITYDCNLRCFNCERSCRQAPSQEAMTVEQIDKFIAESVRQGRKWRTIKIIGGEPTLHPHFFPIAKRLIDYKKSFSPQTKLMLCTNGFGEQVNGILARVPPEIEIANTAKKSVIQNDFISFNVAPIDKKEYRYADFINGCIWRRKCGLGLTPYGYYFCSTAGGIDRVIGLNIGQKQLPSPLRPIPIAEQSVLCRYCGWFKCFKLKTKNQQYVSPTWKKIYENYQREKPKLTWY